MAGTISQIPVTNDPYDQIFTIDLDGVIYTMQFRFNDRLSRWSMDIMDQFKNPILMGVNLVTSWNLLAAYTDAALPPGKLFCFDTSGNDNEPDDTNLGITILLLYQAVNS